MAKNNEFLDQENAKVLATLIADPTTPEGLRVNLIKKLLDISESDNFFRTIYEEKLSFGKCPSCGHKNHWLVPEGELNKMNWVTHEKDDRVYQFTDKESCDLWEQACKKKKVNV